MDISTYSLGMMGLAQLRYGGLQLIDCSFPSSSLATINDTCYGDTRKYGGRRKLDLVIGSLAFKPSGHRLPTWVGVGGTARSGSIASFRMFHYWI